MKTLEYFIDIAADPKKVWDIMLAPGTYEQWVGKSWPGSHYKGFWKKGENIRFLSQENGGTMATIIELKPYEFISAKHIAIVNGDGTEDSVSDFAKGWVGTIESYTFREKGNKTELKVEITTNPAWEKMFNDGWPPALNELKRICEA